MVIQNNKYKGWEILSSIPDGWKIDKTAGSPVHNCVFITNGKSVLNGQKRALLKLVEKRHIEKEASVNSNSIIEKLTIPIPKEDFVFPAKTVNDLARKAFQYQLLKEIMVDLMVCEIEGWDKLEYIRELKTLINGIKVPPSV